MELTHPLMPWPARSLSGLVLEKCSLAEVHLESCYALPAHDVAKAAEHGDADEQAGSSSSSSSRSASESAAVELLASRLPHIFEQSACPPGACQMMWGIPLADESASRDALLAAFLGAREWEVDRAESFLIETLAWRRENSVGEDVEEQSEPELFPKDMVRTITQKDADGQPQTFVVIKLGTITKEALHRVDDFVAWRVREQERACFHLGKTEHWVASPKGPKYTLVLDTAGMRPFHLGSDSRAALAKLTHVFTHYYPDFIGATRVVNAPWFVTATWSAVSRFMPAWWGVSLGTMDELEAQPGWSS